MLFALRAWRLLHEPYAVLFDSDEAAAVKVAYGLLVLLLGDAEPGGYFFGGRVVVEVAETVVVL